MNEPRSVAVDGAAAAGRPNTSEETLQVGERPPPPASWPVLPARGLALVHGPRGVGRTHVLTGCAAVIATAGDHFGRTAPIERWVLFVSCNMSAATLAPRMAAAFVAANGLPELRARLTLLTPELGSSDPPDPVAPATASRAIMPASSTRSSASAISAAFRAKCAWSSSCTRPEKSRSKLAGVVGSAIVAFRILTRST